MFNIQFQGLKHVRELTEMLGSLKRMQFRLHRDASGEVDMNASMLDLEREIDRKLARFSHNPLAKQFAASAKQQLRQRITEHADRGRRGIRPLVPFPSKFRKF